MKLPYMSSPESPFNTLVTVEFPMPIFRPRLPAFEAVAPYLRSMDESRVYSNGGPLVRQLEARYADYLGLPEGQVVAVASGTAGLTAAVTVLDESDWLVPSWTFAASPLAVERAGKRIIFRDVLLETGMLDVTSLRGESASPGVMYVMPFGTFSAGDDLLLRANTVIDAAASLANAHGRLASLGSRTAVIFSLHATKILGCGEGGLVALGSQEMARKVRSIINFGFSGARESVLPGFNGKMPEAMAAYALAALDGMSPELGAWQSRLDRARQVTEAVDLDLFSPRSDEIGPYWVVRWPHDGEDMPERLEEALTSRGIATRRWWPLACSRMRAFTSPQEPMPNADRLARNTLGLPMSVDLEDVDFARIKLALVEGLQA
jgi:dTDP-4-amino-4,6-dideoxygalactose transaminase